MQNKEPISSNSSLVNHRQKRAALSWAAAKPEKQAHHSTAQLSLLPHPHAVGQQTDRLPTNKKIYRLFSPPPFPPEIFAIEESRNKIPTQGTVTLQNPQCNSGTRVLYFIFF